MYFKDCIESKSQWSSYERVLTQFAKFVEDCVRHLMKAFPVVEQVAAKDGKRYHATVTLLTRHVCEFIDGVSVLSASGCNESCKPLLRSAFEAFISVCYILEKDTERRALAYQVVHAHNRIKLYRSMMPTEQAGQELRKTIQSDPIGVKVNLPILDYQKAIDNLENLFLRPEYAGVEQAWQMAKNQSRGEPKWFSLFGGPINIRALAIQTKHGGWYELLYRRWSEAVHAGGILDNVAISANGQSVFRPIRHPDGLQATVSLAGGLCISLARQLIEHYAPDRKKEMDAAYVSTLQKRYLEVSSRKPLITASWK